MFDQSFSIKNLSRIYHIENKRGVNLSSIYFPGLLEKYEDLKRVRRLINRLFIQRSIYKKLTFENRLSRLYEKKKACKDIVDSELEKYLEGISRRISNQRFSLALQKLPVPKNGKDVYALSGSPDSFFAEKQIQKNIRYAFDVKQSDRDFIIPQIKSMLSDSVPKYILKLDIDSFYESIDTSIVINKINENINLGLSSRRIISRLLNEYARMSGGGSGLPRGVGVSAYLAELYLKGFDDSIRSVPGVTYYSRYVDDIILIVSDVSGLDSNHYYSIVEELLGEVNLSIKASKTKIVDTSNGQSSYVFDYLGYSFSKQGKKLNVSISRNRQRKYRARIDASIDSYLKNSKRQPRRSIGELYERIGYLTANTRLSNNKGNALVGVYYSNKWVDDYRFLDALDDYLSMRLGHLNISDRLRGRLNAMSFKDGFEQKRFRFYRSDSLKKIVGAWSV